MTDPTAPRSTGYDANTLVWPEFVDPGPADPRLYAWAIDNLGRDRADWTPAPDLNAPLVPDYGDDAPDHVLMARAIDRLPRPAFSAPSDDGPDTPTTAQNPSSPSVPEAVPAAPPGGIGALSAEDAATLAAATVPTTLSTGHSVPNTGQPALAPPRDGSGLPLRPELSGGPDSLVAAMAGPNPNDNPFGYLVDPKTGSVSRMRMGAGGGALQPSAPMLEPVGPQEKQTYLEWLTGARANYPLGVISPQEQQLRLGLHAAAPSPGAPSQEGSATVSGRTVTYRNPDGSTYQLKGPRPNRNQNPMNLGIGPAARHHGALGVDHSFAIFPSARQAFDASMERMSDIAQNHSSSHGQPVGSLANSVYVWSPPGENDTEGMIHYIMKATGLDRNAQWSSLTLDQKKAFLRAYGSREGYTGKIVP